MKRILRFNFSEEVSRFLTCYKEQCLVPKFHQERKKYGLDHHNRWNSKLKMGFASAASKQGISLEKSSKRGLTLIFLFKKTKRRVFISNLDEVTKLHHLKYKRG